jgi:hypothetical protein
MLLLIVLLAAPAWGEVVVLSPEHYVDPTTGRPVSLGYLYVGEPDTDPTVVGNQKTVTLQQEDGNEVAASQPIALSAGGVPTYNGSPVQVLVSGDYSITVQDRLTAQVYHISTADDFERYSMSSVDTLAALKALSIPDYTRTIYMIGRVTASDGGEGVFVWDSSDLSTEVTLDTLSGIYAPPNSDATGASGAWVRQYDGKASAIWWGAFPIAAVDDNEDHTAALQATATVMSGVGQVTVPTGPLGGVYMIDGVTDATLVREFNMPSDSDWTWEPGVEWHKITTDSSDYRMIDIRGVENVTLTNPVLIGDKDRHTGLAITSLTYSAPYVTCVTAGDNTSLGAMGAGRTVTIKGAVPDAYNGNVIVFDTADINTFRYTPVSVPGSSPASTPGEFLNGEGGFGIGISGTGGDATSVNNINIYNYQGSKMWGDAFIVLNGSGIYVEDAFLDDNRRTGATIAKGLDIHFNRIRISNTNGTPPEAGFAFEPDTAAGYLDNITVRDLQTEDNVGPGAYLNINKFPDGGNDRNFNISMFNHRSSGDIYGLSISKMPEGTGGEILTGRFLYQDSVSYNTDSCGIIVFDYAANNTPELQFINNTIIDPNANGSAILPYDSGICINRDITTATTDIGNFRFVNSVIKDTRTVPLMANGIGAVNNDDVAIELDNAYFIDPIEISGYTGGAIRMNVGGAIVTDQFDQAQLNIDAGNVDLSNFNYSSITNTSAIFRTIDESFNRANLKDNAGMTIEIVNRGTGGLEFCPDSSSSVLPYVATDGVCIQTLDPGARMFVRYVQSVNDWFIDGEPVGDWTYPGAIYSFSALYDFAVHTGAVGTYNLAPIPDNFTVTEATYEVLTAPTSDDADPTIAISTSEAANEIVTATLFSDNIFTKVPGAASAPYHDGIPDGTAANFTTKTTATGTIDLDIAVNPLTAGKILIHVKGTVSE